MTAQKTRSTIWDQESFELTDRRRSPKKPAIGAEKQHDLLHFDFEPATGQNVHSILQKHTRHTDSVHSQGDAVFLSCTPGDAAGLSAKLDRKFKAINVSVQMRHNTFATGSKLNENLENLKRR